jgi:two-component system cell cycle sensor histidine kinase/response regulator CckA
MVLLSSGFPEDRGRFLRGDKMPATENLRILLIEGRGGIARALLSSQSGFTIMHADRLAKAAALAVPARASGGFAAILLDLSLPDGKGVDAYRRVSSQHPGTPIVTLGQGPEAAFAATAETLIAEGAQACLDKDGLDGGALALALRQAVLRARAESRRFRALFDASPIGILLAAGRRVAMANPAALEMLGYAEEDLARISVLDLFPAEAHAILEKSLDAGAEEIPETRFAVDLRRRDETAFRCRVFVTRALLNDAPAVGLYLAPLEQTQGGAAEAGPAHGGALGQSRKMEALGRLAGGIAHDFNNLLTAINGYSEHLLGMPGAEGPIAAGLNAIRRAGETAAAMSRSLMSFGRSESEEAMGVPVDAAVREMEPVLRSLLGDRIDFRMRLGAGGAEARLQAGQLEQMVLNLCANARDAMPAGGSLTLSTETAALRGGESSAFTHLAPGAGEYVAITMEDTGTGMGPDVLECLFEPFFTTKRGGRGTGLGLAVVYAIASQAGGGIAVESVPGTGSRFRILLGRHEGGTVTAAAAPERAWQAQGNKERVMVVEDEPSLREMIVTILQRYGFELIEAASADEAMDIAAERPEGIDLVVTDIMLRGEGGHELAERLQQVKPGLRTVFISGHSLETLADRGIVVPAEAFLEKPFAPAQLAAKVRMLLDAAGQAN